MNIPSPAAWADRQAQHWQSMPVLLRNIITVAAIELLLLGTLAIWFQLPDWAN